MEANLLEAAKDSAIVAANAERVTFSSLGDLPIHRSDALTLLAGALPPGFRALPHNHNLWSLVSVCAGQEENLFFEREGEGLKPVGEASVVAPGVLHAYVGDLIGTPRSNWDPETHKEIPFDWEKVRSK